MIKKIAYLGLGTMGSGMASNLLKASYELTVWNQSAEKCEPFARKGAHVADTPAGARPRIQLAAAEPRTRRRMRRPTHSTGADNA